MGGSLTVQDPTNCLLGARTVLRAQGADDARHRVGLIDSVRSGSVSSGLMAGIAFWVDEHDQNMISMVDERMGAVGFEHHDRARQRTTFTIHDARRTSIHDELEGVVRACGASGSPRHRGRARRGRRRQHRCRRAGGWEGLRR